MPGIKHPQEAVKGAHAACLRNGSQRGLCMDGAPLDIGHRPAASWRHPTPHDLYGGRQSKRISHMPAALQMEPVGHECSFIFNFLFLSHTWQHSGVGMPGTGLVGLCARQMPYRLYYCSGISWKRLFLMAMFTSGWRRGSRQQLLAPYSRPSSGVRVSDPHQ